MRFWFDCVHKLIISWWYICMPRNDVIQPRDEGSLVLNHTRSRRWRWWDRWWMRTSTDTRGRNSRDPWIEIDTYLWTHQRCLNIVGSCMNQEVKVVGFLDGYKSTHDSLLSHSYRDRNCIVLGHSLDWRRTLKFLYRDEATDSNLRVLFSNVYM